MNSSRLPGLALAPPLPSCRAWASDLSSQPVSPHARPHEVAACTREECLVPVSHPHYTVVPTGIRGQSREEQVQAFPLSPQAGWEMRQRSNVVCQAVRTEGSEVDPRKVLSLEGTS